MIEFFFMIQAVGLYVEELNIEEGKGAYDELNIVEVEEKKRKKWRRRRRADNLRLPYKSTEYMQNVLQIAHIRTILD